MYDPRKAIEDERKRKKVEGQSKKEVETKV